MEIGGEEGDEGIEQHDVKDMSEEQITDITSFGFKVNFGNPDWS